MGRNLIISIPWFSKKNMARGIVQNALLNSIAFSIPGETSELIGCCLNILQPTAVNIIVIIVNFHPLYLSDTRRL